MRQSLYKYFSEPKWAEEFLDGGVFFCSLAYFRDYEDEGVRKDKNEGTAIYRPKGGLVINNQTQGKTFTLPSSALESRANQEEIYVFCTSKMLNDEMRTRFKAKACVEILRIQTLLTRIRNGLRTRPGTSIVRSGPVVYREETEDVNPLWAFPDMLALSKSRDYEWQHEYRFIFCSTDALGFEKGSYRLVLGEAKEEAPRPTEHHKYLVKARSLRDICRLHEF